MPAQPGPTCSAPSTSMPPRVVSEFHPDPLIVSPTDRVELLNCTFAFVATFWPIEIDIYPETGTLSLKLTPVPGLSPTVPVYVWLVAALTIELTPVVPETLMVTAPVDWLIEMPEPGMTEVTPVLVRVMRPELGELSTIEMPAPCVSVTAPCIPSSELTRLEPLIEIVSEPDTGTFGEITMPVPPTNVTWPVKTVFVLPLTIDVTPEFEMVTAPVFALSAIPLPLVSDVTPAFAIVMCPALGELSVIAIPVP